MTRTNAFGMTPTQVWIAAEEARRAEQARVIESRRREQEAEQQRRIAQREAAQANAIEAWRGTVRLLDAVADPLSRVVLDLHQRVGSYYGDTWSCDGCDMDGYEAERPEWPCRTTRAVAAHHGIALPDYEATRPSDGSADAT